MPRADIVDGLIDPAILLATFTNAHPGAGAIVSFTGQMRGAATDDAPLAALHLQGYRGMTLASVVAIVAQAMVDFTITDALATHRVGRILPGEAIVFVATAAAHRRAAFDAADWLMDQLKSRAMLWKREERVDGASAWIEPTSADRDALARWEQR